MNKVIGPQYRVNETVSLHLSAKLELKGHLSKGRAFLNKKFCRGAFVFAIGYDLLPFATRIQLSCLVKTDTL